jgi:sugar phosphate isomerase/epimerase
MKLGCSMLAYQFVGWPFWEILESIASLGYEGTEIDFGINPFDAEMRPGAKYLLKEEKRLRKYLKRLELELPSLCIMSRWSGSDDWIAGVKDTLKDVVELSQRFGIGTIVVVSGPPAPDLSPDVIWRQVIDNLKWASEYTGNREIKLAVEVVTTWPIYNIETFRKAKEAIGDNFYANIDPSNYYQSGDDPIDAVRKLKEYIVSVHVKDAKQYEARDDNVPAARGYSAMGEGDIDFEQFLKTLKEVGYDGWLHAEYEGFFGGYNPDPVKGSKDTIDYIKPILNSI